MSEIGEPVRRVTVIPIERPVVAPEEPKRAPSEPLRPVPAKEPAKFPAPHTSGNVDELLRTEPRELFGGVFSFKNPLDAKIEGASWLWWTPSNFALNCIALGSISIWGEVYEHERGYRAQFARVRSLDCIIDRHSGLGHAGAALERLRSLYCGPRLTHREE